MSVEILMPELGESVHEGTVSRWLKKEGDTVIEDEPIVEIMTDKVNTELPSPASGILTEILIPEGSPVHVFHVMGRIAEAGESSHSEEPIDSKSPAAESTDKSSPVQKAQTVASGARKWYTPVVRAMAKENGISEAQLEAIAGTGEGNRVRKKDLEAYLSSAKEVTNTTQSVVTSTIPNQELVPLVGMRKMIAEAMVRSAAVPTVTTMVQVDVTNLWSFRDQIKDSFASEHGVKLTFTPFFIKAVSEAIAEYPLLNASLNSENHIAKSAGVHIGVAVALGKNGDEGLIVPVIRDCQSKSLVDLANALDSIAKRARSNTLAVADVQGGTFTLTNPGSYGALFGTPMINAPQAAILGTYAIVKMPVVINDMIAIRSMMHLVLTYDHRLIDGLVAGRFLQSIKKKLEEVAFLK